MEFTKNPLRSDDSLQNICHDWTMVLTKYPPGFDVVLWKIGQLYQQKNICKDQGGIYKEFAKIGQWQIRCLD